MLKNFGAGGGGGGALLIAIYPRKQYIIYNLDLRECTNITTKLVDEKAKYSKKKREK